MTELDAENQIFKDVHPRIAPVDASTFEYAPDSLIYAVKKKNKNDLDRLLASGFQINSRDSEDVSLLHYAVKTGDPEFFEYVISKNPHVNVVSRDETILMTAASKKNEQIIRILIEKGATQDYVTAKGKIALDFGNESARKVLVNYTGDDLKSKRKICEAARENNTEEVLYLLAKGSSINEKDKDGMTPYLYACKNGNLSLLSILTKLGCNEEVSDNDGNNGAFLATLNRQHKILKFLYLRGIDFKFAIKGETMLHVAIINNDFDTVKYLLDLKFDQSIRNKDGLGSLFYAISLDRDKIIPLLYNEKSKDETYNDMNPVMFAVEKNRLNTVKKLVELKSDTRYRNQQGFDSFTQAVKNGFIDIANFLIESGIDVNENGPGGDSALMTAIRYSNLEMQKFILYKNCSLTTENKTGENCYQYCVLYKKYDIINLLLQKVNDDQTYKMARKSLYMAIEANDFDSTKILLDFFNRENKDPYDCLVKYAKTQEMRALLIKADQNDVKLKVKKGRTIFDSCSENFVQEIKYFIVQNEGNLEMRNPSGWTPLIMAAGCGQIDSVKYLVSIGADRFAKTNGGSTAISIATQYGYTKIIDYLMSVGLSPNDFVSGGQNCLCLAASEGKIDVVRFLVEEKSIDINEKNQYGKKAIFCATEKGRNEVVQYLISKGADVNDIGFDGIPLAFLAYQKGQNEVYKTLIENGAQTNVNDKNGLNMFHYAATRNDIETAQKCIESGADINEARESDHLTPYLIACYSGSLEFLQFLEQKGAVFDLESCNGVGPLYAASEGGHLNVVQYLIEVKNITSKKDIHGMTPLLVACKFGHENIVDYLLTKGSDYSERDNENCSALYYACQNGSLSLVKKLVESKKFDVNEKCWNGNTCLHVACLNGNADVVKYLIRKKASLDQRTKSDSLPIHLAAQNNHSGVLKVLLNANKEMIDERGYNYNTPLTIACLNEAYEAAKFLLQNGAKINARNATRLSVMHLAAAEGRIYLIRELLKLGFDVNEKLDNETPLGRASMHCQWDTVTFLLSNGAVKENTKAYSALHRCVAEDRMSHFKKLLTLGFKMEEKGIKGRTPIVTAILNKNMDFIDYFIENNVELNAKDDENMTPIYHAITVGSKDILEKLIQNGSLVNYQRLQDTPVMFAISNSNSEMLKILLDNGADPNLDSKIGKFPAHFAVLKDDSNFLQILSGYETNYNVKDREFEFSPLVMLIVNKKEVNTK
ncbi:hypothetical protein TVAG_251180 [Trichomonas vaginalis G3]|uniref:Uncharacterized protein n=1 Tax=Trichomonas vaginalis (strain ATCC PRA-98 / G3) TaxID=412133 RepID=A2FUY3_TRIV3|nr:ankyrin repeat-containing family [Trichomonas vaginalis G3]EAX91274.1 hypothetical protein TVAG_251180 [Trichomonas vaginalis G3]KAI5538442.1 ankyrin repeat-containing family [Trichomonas vaginalis G3]|eukprot:XP_001304204.1 hypothetical protein [Trichomonas vaginalis G3]